MFVTPPNFVSPPPPSFQKINEYIISYTPDARGKYFKLKYFSIYPSGFIGTPVSILYCVYAAKAFWSERVACASGAN